MATCNKTKTKTKNMNLEQREKVYRSIQKLEGLLAYAVRHGDEAEASRIRAELHKLISGL